MLVKSHVHMIWWAACLKLVFFLCHACSWGSSEAAKAGLWIQGERFSALEWSFLPKRRVKAGGTVLQVVKLFYLATLILQELCCELAVWPSGHAAACVLMTFLKKEARRSLALLCSKVCQFLVWQCLSAGSVFCICSWYYILELVKSLCI